MMTTMTSSSVVNNGKHHLGITKVLELWAFKRQRKGVENATPCGHCGYWDNDGYRIHQEASSAGNLSVLWVSVSYSVGRGCQNISRNRDIAEDRSLMHTHLSRLTWVPRSWRVTKEGKESSLWPRQSGWRPGSSCRGASCEAMPH